MRLEAFFDKIKNCEKYKLEEFYVLYIISNKMRESNYALSYDDIYNYMESIYGVKPLVYPKFRKFLSSNFKEVEDEFLLTQRQNEILKKMTKFRAIFFEDVWDSEESLLKMINECIGVGLFNFEEKLIHMLTLDKKKNNNPDDYYSALYFYTLYVYDDHYICVDKIISSMNKNTDCYLMNLVFDYSLINDLLFANNIVIFNDFKILNVDSILLLLSVDYDNCIASLNSLEESSNTSIDSIVNEIYSFISSHELEMIADKYGFYDNNEKTLEEVGQKRGLTRERVRQLIAKGVNKLKDASLKYRNKLIAIYQILNNKNEHYLYKDDVLKSIGIDSRVNMLLILYSFDNLPIVYNQDFNVLYNSNNVNLNDVIDDHLSGFGKAISENDFEMLPNSVQSIVLSAYKKKVNGLYIRKGCTQKDLLEDLLIEMFPTGYHISDDEQYNLLKTEFSKRYGDDISLGSKHAVNAMIERMDFCQIDKGIYKSIKECVVLPDELEDNILLYISQNMPSVFYQQVYTHFNKELSEIGVSNYYYLKGLIDPKLPSEFNTKRNYIQGESKIRSTDMIVLYMKSFNGVFTLNDLSAKFEGIPLYTINNVLYSEINNGLIWLSSKHFIYFDNMIVSKGTISELETFVNSIFELQKSNVITSRKVFGRLSMTNKKLLENLNVIDNHFSLFSLLKYVFKDKYYFKRPQIAKTAEDAIGSVEIISNHCLKMDKFNKAETDSFIAKTNIRGLYSYLEFMEDMSDNFVQVSMDTMVKKEFVGFTEKFSNEFVKLLNMMFTKIDSINTSSFRGYAMLPKLEYRWNKYLLVGIIRTFYSNVFEVENTSSFYNFTDFIIRRI